MCGNADVYIYNFEIGLIQKILLFFYLFNFSKNLIKIINHIKKNNPDLIRCYNINYQIFIAEILQRKYNLRYIVSLHYDLYNHLKKKNFIFKLIFNFRVTKVLKKAYKILPVYDSATRYLKYQKIKNYIITYNFINSRLSYITDKKMNKTPNFVCTNRQYPEKNPINIIKAVEKIPNVKLTIIGNGPLNSYLQGYVKSKNLENRIFFIKSIKNDNYMKILKNFDAFISCTYINEFSKGMIEAMASSLPIIVNHQGIKIKELSKKFSLLNSDSCFGYKKSILKIINDKSLKIKLSINAKKIYLKKYESQKCEKEFQNIYSRAIK